MKKKLVASLAAAMVLGVAGTSFAAANPFVDVPAKHWAYASVMTLSQAGIVDGYSDGKFQGDKMISRYEMAQIVAKAMAKSDKADAKQKAEIEKLAAEFATELNTIGVRVSKLEANQSAVKFAGNFQTRYTAYDYADGTAGTGRAEYRLRLDGNVAVNDVTTANFRFVTRTIDKGAIANSTWQLYGENGQSSASQNNIDRINATTKIGNITGTLGRQAFWVDTQGAMMDSGAFSFDGVKATTKTGDVTVTGTWGRFTKGATTSVTAPDAIINPAIDNLDVASLMVGSKIGKFDWSLGYYKLKDAVTNDSPFQWTVLNTNYNVSSKLSLNAEYLHNSGTFAGYGADKGKNYWAVRAIAGDQNVVSQGQQNLTIQYADKQANSSPNIFTALGSSTGATAALATHNFTQWDLQYKYGMSKNVSTILEYTSVTPETGKGTKAELKQYRALAVVVF